MKKNLTFLLVVLFFCVSCKNQHEKQDSVRTSEMELSPDESQRLLLLIDNPKRNHDQVLAAAKIDSKTKPISQAKVIDSLVSAVNTKSTGDPLVIYVVSNGDNKGFTLVNKDIRLAPIVGFVETGNYEPGVNPGLSIMLENVLKEQVYIRDSVEKLRGDQLFVDVLNKLGINKSSTRPPPPGEEGLDNRPTVPWDRYETTVEEQWQVRDYEIGPLLKTRWGQDNPYNSFRHDGCPTGCTATSAAQIMAHYKKPAVSPITGEPYFWNEYPTLTYDWPARVKQNIGGLMHDLGSHSCLNIIYTINGSFPSSLNCTNTPRTFEIYGYNGGAHRSYDLSAIHVELSHNRPVHVCGISGAPVKWHTWVIDGALGLSNWQRTSVKFYYGGELVWTIYQNSIYNGAAYVHHNLGWSGSGDGWFSSNSRYWEFNKSVEIIVGISPK